MQFNFNPLLILRGGGGRGGTDNCSHTAGNGEAIPVTGRGGLYGFTTSRLPHFLDSRLTDGGEVFSLTRRPPFTPHECSWYSFLLETVSTPEP
jgi:hypothetical protein